MTKGKKYKKQAGSYGKTFSVPFAMEEIKENITITTNAPTQPSKEQIINKARKLHKQGNITEATKYYQELINDGCNDHRVFSNYGTILQNLGQLQEAELLYRKAIEIKPDFVDAHSNLVNILIHLGNFKAARLCSEKIMSLRSWSIFGSYSFNHEMKLD